MTLPHKAPRKNLQAEMLVCMANKIKIKDDVEEVIRRKYVTGIRNHFGIKVTSSHLIMV